MDFDEAVRIIRQKDPRYQPQAYDVVRLGLDLAQKLTHGEPKKGKSTTNRHVSGPQLLEGFRQHVLETWTELANGRGEYLGNSCSWHHRTRSTGRFSCGSKQS